MITYHHIGGRNGTYPLPLKKGLLLQDFHLILYDADTNCFEQMKHKSAQNWGKVDVYPYCIGGKTGVGEFQLNFHPTTNSLYHFNEAYAAYNYVNNALYGEYVFGDACKHIRSVTLDLFSLEDALKRSHIPHIDFLSLDVQGAEYDVLEGAVGLLQQDCIGIQLEAEFVPLYKDQKTFSDINALMDQLGFELLELGSFGRCSPISLPIGFRGQEQPLYGEAVYIKKTDTLFQGGSVDSLYKAAFFCLIYKKLGLSFRFLSRLAELGVIDAPSEKSPLYVRCLSEMWACFEAAQQVKLPKLSQLFSNEKFQNYYAQKNVSSGSSESEAVKHHLKKLRPQVLHLQDQAYSPLEEILLKYELNEVVEVVKQQRAHETACFFELLGEPAKAVV